MYESMLRHHNAGMIDAGTATVIAKPWCAQPTRRTTTLKCCPVRKHRKPGHAVFNREAVTAEGNAGQAQQDNNERFDGENVQAVTMREDATAWQRG